MVLTTVLLPWCYWTEQFRRTDQPLLRLIYQALVQKSQALWEDHPLSHSLPLEERQHWLQWAEQQVRQFQRASSAVEGRNGYLSQIYHNRRGLSTTRLHSLTIIHNFALRRPDGTTAAQRLFQIEFPDLWEYVLAQPFEIPMSRQVSQPTTASL